MKTFAASFSLSFDDNDSVMFSGTGDVGTISQLSSDTITTTGTDQTVNLSITGAPMTLVDQGSGLNVGIGESVTAVSVEGFQNDPTGQVTLRLATALPSLAPDGNGGTILTVKNDGGVLAGAQVDFVNDPLLTMSQISGGDPPPAPAPVPAAPPAAPAAPAIPDPPQTLVNSHSPDNATTDGGTYMLDQGSNLSAVGGNATIMMFGYNDSVTATQGGGDFVMDNGYNAHIAAVQADVPTLVDVMGTAWNWGNGYEIANASGAVQTPTITPDGHGGTSITAGNATIDLMYNPYVAPGQVIGH